MLADCEDKEEIIARVAALDIGKAELVCCVRVPAPRGRRKRLQEVSTHSTMTSSLTELANRLVELRVQRVVMEATSDYWKPVFYLLEAHGLDPWLVNARDVKHLPGRPKTDVIDAVWLCKLAERQMLRASFVPPTPIRRLRDLTRYRADLVAARTAEKNRVEKLLEDAGIKLSVVASDIFGASGRAMMAALIAGERDPKVLAQLARRRMRTKIAQLEEAFNGHFDEHHRFLLARMLARTTASIPTSPPLTSRSRRIWPLSRRQHGWMAYPASGRSRPPPSSPRSAWTCPGSQPPDTCVPGPNSHPGSRPPPEKPKATDPPGMATVTSPESSVR